MYKCKITTIICINTLSVGINVGINVGLNVGINVGLNKTAEQIIRFILEDPKTTSEILAEKIGVSKRTIERNIKKLMEQNRIARSGSKKTGFWVVIK